MRKQCRQGRSKWQLTLDLDTGKTLVSWQTEADATQLLPPVGYRKHGPLLQVSEFFPQEKPEMKIYVQGPDF